VLMLVERGSLGLDDRVAEFIPAFVHNGKHEVRVRHLLTHTSGLPDMVPENNTLRAAHAPLAAFLDAIVGLRLDFPSGTRVQYQSMGFAVLAEIVHQVAGRSLAEFLKTEIFEPLGMLDTTLGWAPAKKTRIAAIRLAPEQQATDWNWNPAYWLGFG